MPAAATACSPRDRLLDAATELFATRGYQAIGLRDLASHHPRANHHFVAQKRLASKSAHLRHLPPDKSRIIV